MSGFAWAAIVLVTVAFGFHAWESNGGPEWPATIASVAAMAAALLVLLLAVVPL